MDWTQKEVHFIVEDYFAMLKLELDHIKYNKSAHRTSLLQNVKRSEGSIEFKHQNISAVLAKMGLPFIKGYKPRFNYQKNMLETEVSRYLQENKKSLERIFKGFSDEEVTDRIQQLANFEEIIDNEPVNSLVNEEEPQYRPIKTNYLEKEQNNRQLGEQGEKLVIAFEKWRLIHAGKADLVKKIEWVSKNLGDGTGYDILSKNLNGSDRYIEVKTTKLSKETPIYLTATELKFASKKGNDFFLYRVFNIASNPKIFIRQGDYEGFCKLYPVKFKGYF